MLSKLLECLWLGVAIFEMIGLNVVYKVLVDGLGALTFHVENSRACCHEARLVCLA